MLKKIVLLAVVGVAAVAVLKNTRIGGYAKHEAAQIEEYFDQKIPFEKKIAQLRKEISGLNSEADRLANDVAGAIYDARETSEQLAREQVALAEEEKRVRAMAELIRNGVEKVSYGRETLPIGEAKQRLFTDVKRVSARRQTVETLQQTLASRETVRDTLKLQMNELSRQKVELSAEVDKLEAEFRSVQLKQMESRYQFDDTRLTRIKEKLRNLKRDVSVQAEKLKLKPQIMEDQTGVPANGLTVEEILAPLNGKVTEKKID